MQKHFFISIFSFLLLITGCMTESAYHGADDDIDPAARTLAGRRPRPNPYRERRLLRKREWIRQEKTRQEEVVARHNSKEIIKSHSFALPEDIKQKHSECAICFEEKSVYRYCLANNPKCTIWQCKECCVEVLSTSRQLKLIDNGEDAVYTATSQEARCTHCRLHLPGTKQVGPHSFKFYTNGDINTIMNISDPIK